MVSLLAITEKRFKETVSYMGKLYVGTSGWVYGDWNGIFYPENLSSKDRLRYFSQHFKTAEINYSFYHLPKPETYQNWYNQTPADFAFAVKASRYITHIKRLRGVKTAWKRFLNNALHQFFSIHLKELVPRPAASQGSEL